MSAPANCQLIGRWRIVEADLWNRDHLDLVDPATITTEADNHGEIAFGALQAGLDLSYGPNMVFFTWAGFDEMDEVTGDGSLLDDGSITITFAYHNGDEAILNANATLLQQPARNVARWSRFRVWDSQSHRRNGTNSMIALSQTIKGIGVDRFVPRASLFGILLGVLFLAASLTPSLIPRGPTLQGILGGLVMGLGYLCWRVIELVWQVADMPVLKGRVRQAVEVIGAIFVLAILVFAMRYSVLWQNDLRDRMGLDGTTEAHVIRILLTAALVFAVLFVTGAVVSACYRFIRSRLNRVMPRRRANVLGFLLVLLVLFVITRDGLLDSTIAAMDETYEAGQFLFERAPHAPEDARFPGSRDSLVDWGAMGQPGRDFVTSGPDEAVISAFTGQAALNPIRVYVGRANAETPEDRAKLALAELLRLDAFKREILVVASPTGTGWMDPGSHDPVEYMHGGDIATVAVQYSYLQSPLALLFETRTGLDQATATVSTIYGYWSRLPKNERPRLYIHGLSLGAWSSMHATTLFQLVNDPINGAFWAGPPFPSNFWNYVQRARNDGSPWVQPKIGDGSIIRYASHTDDESQEAANWGDIRIMFLQYSSDPIVFFDPLSFWRRPIWMREPPGDGVSPYLRFMPIVTQFQLALDMALATTAPAGFGHGYYAQDYIEPWVMVTEPKSWSRADTERLKAHCDNGFQNGCSN